MDGYTICSDHQKNVSRIIQHASTHDRLVHLLEECVPAGSEMLGMVLSSGSQTQPTKPLQLVP
jgi:hypothetical protein